MHKDALRDRSLIFMEEPNWKKTLCWGAVISFFAMPTLVFLLIVYNAVRA